MIRVIKVIFEIIVFCVIINKLANSYAMPVNVSCSILVSELGFLGFIDFRMGEVV